MQYQVSASSLSSLSPKHQPKRACKTESLPDSDTTSDSEIYAYPEDTVFRSEESNGMDDKYDTTPKWTL